MRVCVPYFGPEELKAQHEHGREEFKRKAGALINAKEHTKVHAQRAREMMTQNDELLDENTTLESA